MCCPEIDEQTINKSDKHDNYNTTLKNNKTYKHIIKYVSHIYRTYSKVENKER
jgi:hypothetical protein